MFSQVVATNTNLYVCMQKAPAVVISAGRFPEAPTDSFLLSVVLPKT